jgi:predicted permease
VRFIIDVLLLFRPGIIKPAQSYQHLNNTTMLKSYIKIGWRNLIRNKAYSIINIAGLALSMTCAILIFSLVKNHLAFDNFHAESDRIYRIVTELHRETIGYTGAVPSPLGNFVRNDFTFTEKVARVYTESNALVILRKGNDVTKFEELEGVSFTEPEFFDVFNFPLLQGNKTRAITEPNTAIITERIASKYFGNKSAVGETFWLENKIPFTVTGILKDFPQNSDIKSNIFVSWSTMPAYNPWMADDTDGWGGIRDGMSCYIRLRPGVATAQVEEAIDPYVKRFRPKSKNVHHYKLQPLADIHFNAQFGGEMEKKYLWILAVVGLFLIVTACVNFVNLATAQASKRSKEVGVRKVLGSYRRQLFWQFIVETGIIAFTGIALAAMFAYMICPFVNTIFNTNLSINLLTDLELVGFIGGLGLAVTLFAGYYPGLILAGFKPVAALKGKLSSQTVGGFNTRRMLIVAQFAISQVLIIGMIVIMSQMRFAKQSDLGFDKDAVVMIARGNDLDQNTINTLKNEFIKVPGVEKISLCFTAPASEDDWGNSIRFNNDPEEVNFRTSIKSADADYISMFDLELVAGRNLLPSDTVREMVVNEALVRKLGLTPEEALGKPIAANGGQMNGPVVGVIKDFHDKSFHQEINAILVTTNIYDYEHYAVKLNLANAKESLTAIEKIWTQHHPDQLFHFEFLDESIAKFYQEEETMLTLIQVFSFIAIFIGCLGLYGLVSFMTSQKSKEIGIRKVLGGSIEHILWIFGREFLRLIVVAFLIAAPAGWWLMNTWLQEFKFQIPMSAWFFVIAIGTSIFIAAVTVSYQVIRTALMNPVKSLRTE